MEEIFLGQDLERLIGFLQENKFKEDKRRWKMSGKKEDEENWAQRKKNDVVIMKMVDILKKKFWKYWLGSDCKESQSLAKIQEFEAIENLEP